jgi:hypothetical protein
LLTTDTFANDPPLSGQPPMAMIPVTRLSADGCVPFMEIDDPACCPPPLCGNDLCCTFVAFFNLMPSGPLWDYWKEKAISYFESNDDPAQCPLLHDPDCPSLILHAIYTVLKLRLVVHGALWVALRESNPYTAVTTLDNHLSRLQWEDCYNQHCRSVLLGEITPYEIWTECGPLFCPVDFSPELQAALKRAIAIALTRANMGIIKNLCALNWVIEPLGAELRPIYIPTPTHPIVRARCDSMCADNLALEICNTRDWLEHPGNGDVCDTLSPRPHVPAYYDRGCDRPAGLPDRIWPAVLAAECIVRSMMPPCAPTVSRCC